LIVGLALASTTASAHVKWIVNCNVSDDPLPVQAVFTPTFFLLFTLFLILLYLGCRAERTALGASISQLVNCYAAPLHRRADDLLRSAAAISFALLWADGQLIITPELKASSVWLSAIQLLIPMYMFTRATLPAAGAGIIVLYGYGVATYGLFHMLDYPVFIGLGVFFALDRIRRLPRCAATEFVARARTSCARLDPIIRDGAQIVDRAAARVVRRRRSGARCAIARYPLGYGNLDAHRVEWRAVAAPAHRRSLGRSRRRAVPWSPSGLSRGRLQIDGESRPYAQPREIFGEPISR
jgi:hypothetical protein